MKTQNHNNLYLNPREYHFHFQGLGNMGWGIWVFLWGCRCMELRLGFFYVGLGVGLLVVPWYGPWCG